MIKQNNATIIHCERCVKYANNIRSIIECVMDIRYHFIGNILMYLKYDLKVLEVSVVLALGSSHNLVMVINHKFNKGLSL